MTKRSSIVGHRLQLEALIRQESNPAYQRQYYMAKEWQLSLWKDEVSDSMFIPLAESTTERGSPRSVIPSAPLPPSGICPMWREKICEWQYEVVDQFDLDREIVSISTFYLDRYLSLHFVDEDLFQLVSMTSIYLAIKIHSYKKVSIQSIAAMGRGFISVDHITEMELSMMQALDWHLHPPTPVAFVENIFPLLLEKMKNDPDFTKNDFVEFSRFLTELSVCAYPFIAAMPSSVAIAAILYSIEHYQLSEEYQDSLQKIANSLCLDVHAHEVEECGKLLRRVYRLAVPTD